jgi:hypothetical protein
VVEKLTDADLARAALEAFRARYGDSRAQGTLTARAPVRVSRLDRPGAYVLVGIEDGRGLQGIVSLSADAGAVESSAFIRDPGSVFLVSGDTARAAAAKALPDKRGWGAPFLAWRPCRQSFDNLRPLWVVPHADGEAFVTQGLSVSETLTSGKGG